MTDPLGGQGAATGTGQSAGTGDQGTAVPPADGQSAVTPPATPPADAGQSTVSREDFEKLRVQLAAADQKRAAAEQAHAQLRDKDMPAIQKLERDLADSVAAMTAMKTANETLRVENAFLTANEHDWHSPQAALQLLDRSRVTVDADGNVQGMKDALKALATANPFLLKPKPATDGQGATGTPPPPGTSPANGGIAPPAGTAMDAKTMAARFPAMRQKIG